ncbi:unnamed protein product [Pocillopora meandrina]|uniref:Uncharacterized protein n=1 Tax=Pocillopora meandrina TaxID=46732 RepID=A0AAU9WRP9_9CNID|nr:unnamed protein product [Pocillopora meandrina]
MGRDDLSMDSSPEFNALAEDNTVPSTYYNPCYSTTYISISVDFGCRAVGKAASDCVGGPIGKSKEGCPAVIKIETDGMPK